MSHGRRDILRVAPATSHSARVRIRTFVLRFMKTCWRAVPFAVLLLAISPLHAQPAGPFADLHAAFASLV